MAEKKMGLPGQVETADQKLVKRVIKYYESGEKYAACGNCGVHLVNVEERIRCKYCWNCGVKVKWP